MANNYFRFKQFEIKQDRCAHKVGTDGVLIGCWAQSENPLKILDIGSGSGLISLILAQRFPAALITSIEIDQDSYLQSLGNFRSSPFANRIKTVNNDFLKADFRDEKFDLIVSNPPFFNNQFLSGDTVRDGARHQLSLSHQSLLEKSLELLEAEGKLSLILPTEDAITLLNKNLSRNLHLQRRCMLRNKPSSFFKRCMLELGFYSSELEETDLNIRTESGDYSLEYRNMTRDFYL